MSLTGIKVALVHDWLTGMRGGEKVLEQLCRLFPDAPLYTLLHVPGSVSEVIEARPIHTSLLQRLPGAARHYRHALPLMPALIESLRLEPVDLVISTSSCVAKSVRVPRGARHAAYIFSPMRYLYDRYEDYFTAGRSNWPTRVAMRCARGPLRSWDIATSARPHSLAAISDFVAARIHRWYGRAAQVIPPPVDIERFAARSRAPDDYYLMVTALVPYKRIDIAIEAFRGTPRRLVIAGSGPLARRLATNLPRNVELLGWVPDERLPDLVAGCRAFLMPNVEDFGIAAVEAMAAGRPVIAAAEGGARQTVRDLDRWRAGQLSGPLGPSGLFQAGPTSHDLRAAIDRFERNQASFQPEPIQRWARSFAPARFHRSLMTWLEEAARVSGNAPDAFSVSRAVERLPA